MSVQYTDIYIMYYNIMVQHNYYFDVVVKCI